MQLPFKLTRPNGQPVTEASEIDITINGETKPLDEVVKQGGGGKKIRVNFDDNAGNLALNIEENDEVVQAENIPSVNEECSGLMTPSMLEALNSHSIVADETNGIIKATIGNKTYAIPGISLIEKPAKPTISAGGSATDASRSVTITCGTSGAKIYYTTNGSTPTSGSTLYSSAFTLSASTSQKETSATVKAIAIKNGESSDVTTLTVKTARHLAAPTLSADGNDYSTSTNGRTVTISHSTSGVTIQYKIGSSGTWQTYSTPFKITSTSTIYAKASLTDWQDSAEASASYTIGMKPAYYGFSTKSTLTASDITALASTGGKKETQKLQGALTINPTGSTAGYVWLCCVNTLAKDSIVPNKGDVIPFGFESAISVGGYNCYRSTNKINAESTNVYIP